ncbi:MAG: hypothetical protein GY769_11480 [bacterium]|nr:hypothetical protein [bacterium]
MDEPRENTFALSGGALCLDFANTWEDRSRAETEKLHGFVDLLAFADQVGILGRRQAGALEAMARDQPQRAEKALATAIDLREALYRIFEARVTGGSARSGDLERVNAAFADATARLRLETDGTGFAWGWHGLASSFEAPLAPIARSAAELLTGAELERVRECDGERCTWLFLDSSRNRSRRWCSMETCGNRAKARRHYSRIRAVGGPK